MSKEIVYWSNKLSQHQAFQENNKDAIKQEVAEGNIYLGKNWPKTVISSSSSKKESLPENKVILLIMTVETFGYKR